MSELLYSIGIQCKLDIRNRNVLVSYYILPLVFFLVMGSVFSKIDPNSKEKLIQSMSLIAISMSAFLGTPVPIVEIFSSEIKKTYKVGNIPLWVILFTSFFSALIHMLIVSCIIYIVSPIIFNATRPSNTMLYFLLLILVIIVSIIIGMTIGIIVKNNTVMTMFSQLVFLPSMLLSGIMFPQNMLPSILEKLSNILPATQGIKILTSLNEITARLLFPLIIIGLVSFLMLLMFYRKIQID